MSTSQFVLLAAALVVVNLALTAGVSRAEAWTMIKIMVAPPPEGVAFGARR